MNKTKVNETSLQAVDRLFRKLLEVSKVPSKESVVFVSKNVAKSKHAPLGEEGRNTKEISKEKSKEISKVTILKIITNDNTK